MVELILNCKTLYMRKKSRKHFSGLVMEGEGASHPLVQEGHRHVQTSKKMVRCNALHIHNCSMLAFLVLLI